MIRIYSPFILLLIYLMSFNILASESKLPKGIIELPTQPASSFKLNDIDGNTYHFKPTNGHWSFVHFWASWCGPCRKELPTIQMLSEKMQNKPLEIILINTAETEDTVFSFLGGIAPDLNSLLDVDGEVTEQWQPRGLPSTYLVDPNGKLRYVVLGGQPWHQASYYNFLLKLIQRE